jgi:uncharacterized membrane protein
VVIFSFTLSYQPSHLFTLSILYFLFHSFFIVFIPTPVLSDETLPNFIKRKRPRKGEKKKQGARTKVNSPKEGPQGGKGTTKNGTLHQLHIN